MVGSAVRPDRAVAGSLYRARQNRRTGENQAVPGWGCPRLRGERGGRVQASETAPARTGGQRGALVRSVEEQLARITAAAVAPRPIRVAIAEAQGLMCAEEVVTERPMPGFDQAAIDGYAVRSVDVLGVGEVDVDVENFGEPSDESAGDEERRDGLVLPVMGTIEAGARTPSRLQPRQAARGQH